MQLETNNLVVGQEYGDDARLALVSKKLMRARPPIVLCVSFYMKCRHIRRAGSAGTALQRARRQNRHSLAGRDSSSNRKRACFSRSCEKGYNSDRRMRSGADYLVVCPALVFVVVVAENA